jgi:hypothetical protein
MADSRGARRIWLAPQITVLVVPAPVAERQAPLPGRLWDRHVTATGADGVDCRLSTTLRLPCSAETEHDDR